MLLFAIILIILIIFMTSSPKHKQSTFTVSCDSTSDISCKMYNHKDISNKCTGLCKSKDTNSLFANKYSKQNDIYSCECTSSPELTNETVTNIIQQPVKEQFSNDDKHRDSDNNITYSDRNYIEQQNESRLKKLIFG